MTSDLVLTGISKQFAGHRAVDNLDLTVPAGTFFALLGPSGCGKTTTLRMIAGLEEPTTGSIRLGDDEISGLRPYKRPVNTVFQNYALFPHLDIFENVAFGLKRRKVKDYQPKVEEMLGLVELKDYGKRRPAQLSGGQQQRVALARALINRPQVLLLDEPLGALDLKLRRQMQLELKRIQTEVGITFVHVTHDQEEAMTMADTIAVMNRGLIEQLGSPAELYDLPATTFVANFLGQSNLIRAKIIGQSGEDLVVDVHGRKVIVPLARCRVTEGEVWLGIRPEKVFLAPADSEDGDGSNQLRGAVVTDVSYVGVSTQYLARLPWGQELTVFEQNTGAREAFSAGDAVDLHWRPAHSFLLDAAQDALAGVEDVD
ncbi:ABC transporter ATP-binding protein [Kribbella sandramycini]|uniref:Spermidine/putrescine import ATP-binding protein PotA n=1 Tax=Kribbella sandramycini TaxID=60450 RepID=A0A7Y4L099_9ACTN|nr:ABC transporter ATP-binding protein [Kribbella sandramycini]MBB6565670.1 spermidine/putrescine transport system ATP-binding protein [Kribbella sandramycini]NOL41933.1 ABC transporter ATP-binding protein [Kribbella sandramycini]